MLKDIGHGVINYVFYKNMIAQSHSAEGTARSSMTSRSGSSPTHFKTCCVQKWYQDLQLSFDNFFIIKT